jgi:hypothetical protein
MTYVEKHDTWSRQTSNLPVSGLAYNRLLLPKRLKDRIEPNHWLDRS